VPQSHGIITGNVLHVDLARRESWREELDPAVVRLLLGGRGLAVYLLYKYGRTVRDPLSPENPLVFAPGALVGSGLSTASKSIFAARSPQTGLLGRSSVGARLGLELRKLGFDALVIHGALDEPGVLVLDGDGPRVEPAGSLWGMRVGEAAGALSREYQGYEYCMIGPAGESLSRMAMIDCNMRQAGRTGLGAVMGSKRLKAVLARGSRLPRPARPDELRSLARELAKRLLDRGKGLMERGTPGMVYVTDSQGVLPSKNWTRSTLSWCRDPEARERLAGVARNKVSRNPCPHCGRPCSFVLETRDPLTGEKVRVDGPEYETVYALGTDIGFCSPEAPTILNYLADEYGFDTISLGATIAWALEAAERGLIPGEMLADYPGLGWGRLEPIARLIADMATRRTRLAALLADGSRTAAERLGAGADLAVHVKGLEAPAYDARGLKGMALGYAVGSRGADHLTTGMYAVELSGRLWHYSGVDPLAYEGKGLMARAIENLYTVFDILGVCKFSRNDYTPSVLAEALSHAAGLDVDGPSLLLAAERVVTLERVLNLWYGLDPERDDTLPPRIWRDPIRDGPKKGERVPLERLEEMKAEYYAARGWSREGVPDPATLDMLGLYRLGVSLPEKVRVRF